MSQTTPAALSNERLQEIAAREQAATPGPWHTTGLPYAEGTDDPLIMAAQTYIAQTAYDGQSPSTAHAVDADTEFIAHARQDVPDLLAHLAAREAAFTEALKGLLPPEPTLNSDCADDWEMGIAHAASEYRAQVHRAAASLGLDLTK